MNTNRCFGLKHIFFFGKFFFRILKHLSFQSRWDGEWWIWAKNVDVTDQIHCVKANLFDGMYCTYAEVETGTATKVKCYAMMSDGYVDRENTKCVKRKNDEPKKVIVWWNELSSANTINVYNKRKSKNFNVWKCLECFMMINSIDSLSEDEIFS